MDDAESRIGKWLVLLVLIGCGGWFVSLWMQIESKRTELARIQHSLQSGKLHLESLRARLATADEAKSDQARQAEDLEKSAALLADIERLTASRATVLKQFMDEILDVRSRAAGRAWEDIVMPNGSTLADVKIQKVTDNSVLVSHHGGFARLSAQDLPDSLKEMLRLDMPLTVSPDKSQASTSAKESEKTPDPAPSFPAPATVFPADSGLPAAPAASIDAAKIQLDIDVLRTRINKLQGEKKTWALRSRSLTQQISDTRDAGRPTYNLTVEIAKVGQSIQAVDAEIDRLETEIVRLRKKLIEMSAAGLPAR